MNSNFLSVTFWFNIIEVEEKFIEIFRSNLKDEFSEFKFFEEDSHDYYKPKLTAFNTKTHNNLTFSPINLQYNMETVDIDKFYENVLKLYDILSDNGIKVMHSAIYAHNEILKDDALNEIAQKTITSSLKTKDLVDLNLKFGKNYDDAFYKIISIMNKKQLEIPRVFDELHREVPVPLIPWNKSVEKSEVIDISYEINDKLSFDTASNYYTESAYLNKMLYILKNDMADDINKLIYEGKF